MAVNLFDFGLRTAFSYVDPQWQQTLARGIALGAQAYLPFQIAEVTLEQHPLQRLYHLLQQNPQQQTEQRALLNSVPESLRNPLFFQVWSTATDPIKEGERWGELHALDDPQRLLGAIDKVASEKLSSLPLENKNEIFSSIYRLAGRPQTEDSQWGEHHATDDTSRLIQSLHRDHHLNIPGAKIPYYSLESQAAFPSCTYDLKRPGLLRGQIRFQNGMSNTYEQAYAHALRISDECAAGHNIHCVYSSTIDLKTDALAASIGQGGAMTQPSLYLLNAWLDFFAEREGQKIFQICHSRGAIEVNSALSHLPEPLKDRLIVVALAPACIIEANQAYRVLNLVNLDDPVLQIATNRHLPPGSHVLQFTANNFNPHCPHQPDFRGKLSSLISHYINTNDILH